MRVDDTPYRCKRFAEGGLLQIGLPAVCKRMCASTDLNIKLTVSCAVPSLVDAPGQLHELDGCAEAKSLIWMPPFVVYRYICFDWMLPRSHHPLRAVTCQKCASSTSDILTSLVFSGETIPCSSLVYHCIIIYWLTMSYNCQMPLAEKRFKSSSC